MSKLKSLCADAGFTRIETYIASGNVVFDSELPPPKVKANSQPACVPMRANPLA